MQFYYEQQIKRELKGIHICGCRRNERLKAKTDGSKCLAYTGLLGELEHLTIETRLIGESFMSVWWVNLWSRIYTEVSHQYSTLIRSASALARMCLTFRVHGRNLNAWDLARAPTTNDFSVWYSKSLTVGVKNKKTIPLCHELTSRHMVRRSGGWWLWRMSRDTVRFHFVMWHSIWQAGHMVRTSDGNVIVKDQ